MKQAFVYSWRNKTTNKIYIGWHKGCEDDGYVCSSKVLMEEYQINPQNFERFIIAHGTSEDMAKLETEILKTVNAKDDLMFYNQHNGNGLYHLKEHTQEAKRKISISKIGKKRPDVTERNLSELNPFKTFGNTKPRVFLASVDRSGEANGRYGLPVTQLTRDKISAANKGKLKGVLKSPETKEKMALARKAFWERKRGILNAS
jgi:hypothetical protein